MESEKSVKAEYEPVLYPSGTDLRTRMPTERRLAWTLGGSGGARVSGEEIGGKLEMEYVVMGDMVLGDCRK